MSDRSPCPVLDKCGGCPLFRLGESAELELKHSTLDRLRLALGHRELPVRIVQSPRRVGYRNRIRLRIDAPGTISFFNHDKSADCAVLVPALREWVAELRGLAQSRPDALAGYCHLEARMPDRHGQYGLYLTERAGTHTAPTALAAALRARGAVLYATSHDEHVGHQQFQITDAVRLFVPLSSFLQVNLATNRLLVSSVVAGAKQRGHRSFADLYCGAGNFALPLAHAGLQGLGVERDQACIVAASAAAQAQGVESIQFMAGDSTEVCRQWLQNGLHLDLVIVDPPRAGIRDGLDLFSALAHRSLVYCSCNPATLERDLRRLLAAGWQLEELVGFDMFPGTAHLESVVWLTRG